jgi:hypothetical protein
MAECASCAAVTLRSAAVPDARTAVSALSPILAHSFDPLLGPLAPAGSTLADAVEAIATAARTAVARLGPRTPWNFASAASAGGLLSNTSCPWAGAV